MPLNLNPAEGLALATFVHAGHRSHTQSDVTPCLPRMHFLVKPRCCAVVLCGSVCKLLKQLQLRQVVSNVLSLQATRAGYLEEMQSTHIKLLDVLTTAALHLIDTGTSACRQRPTTVRSVPMCLTKCISSLACARLNGRDNTLRNKEPLVWYKSSWWARTVASKQST